MSVFLLLALWTVKIYTLETHFSHAHLFICLLAMSNRGHTCNTEFYNFSPECHEQILLPAPQITSLSVVEITLLD